MLMTIAGIYRRLLQLFDERFDDLVMTNPCPITAATFLDCMAELIVVLIKSRSTYVFRSRFCAVADTWTKVRRYALHYSSVRFHSLRIMKFPML